MIRIRITLDAVERIVGLEARGHAGAAPHGEDIVCAAVSTLLQTLVLGLEQVVGIDTGWSRDDGQLALRLPEGLDDPGARVLMQTTCLALRQIGQQYPDFVCVEEKRPRSRSGGRDEGGSARASERTSPPSPRKRRKSSTAQEASHE